MLLAWLRLWENPLQGLVASSLISAQQKLSLEVSLSPSGGITITQRRSPQPLRVPPGPTMSRDPLPERTMRTGMAPKGPRWDRGRVPPMPDSIILFLNNQLRYKVQNLPSPSAPPEKEGAGAWPKTSSQTPSQGLKFQWRKGSGIQLGKGPHPGKAGGGDRSLQRPAEHLEVPGAPPSPLNVPEDAGSPQRQPAQLEVRAYPKASPQKT